MTKKNATKAAQQATSPQPGDLGVQPETTGPAATETSVQDQDTTTGSPQPETAQDTEGQGINIADEALKAHVQSVNPDALIGIPVQYHDNGNGTTQRPILPAQLLQKRSGKPDILVVFASTVPMELKAWFAGDDGRNTTEPYWTIPGMGA